jgi:hypothetical protein
VVEGSGRADVVDAVAQQVVVNAGEVHIGYGPTLATWDSFTNTDGLSVDDRFGDEIDIADLLGICAPGIGTTNNHDMGYVIEVATGVQYSIPKPPKMFENPLGETAFGYSVLATDANGDGYTDLLIGDSFDGALTQCAVTSSGCIYVALGPMFSTFAVVNEPNAGCGDAFSWVTERYDVDQDGIDDLIVGAPLADVSGVSNSGRVLIYYGR